MFNSFSGADEAGNQARASLANMISRQEDYKSLGKEMAANFTGAGGRENVLFQADFGNACDQFFASLEKLNRVMASQVGTGGCVQAADNNGAKRFASLQRLA